MKINYQNLLKATISAVLVFIIIDAVVEYIILKVTGVSLLSYFEQSQDQHYGPRFHLFNLIIFTLEMVLVMTSYAAVRPLFRSRGSAIFVCACFFICFIGLFLLQLINLGVYPMKPALIFCVSTLFGFPAALFAGAVVYER
ncbi:MAG: hypothetical protein JW915_19855 [Chitinispirillaceae bacterium]|nr:hypothetical protein [Chitinispirillaceae bacterium]